MTPEETPVANITRAELRLAFGQIDEDANSSAWSSTALRFLLPSVLAVLLLAGGVVWLRNMPSGATSADVSGAVQVRLLQLPEPSPVALQSPGRQSLQSPGPRSEQAPKPVDPTSADVPPTQQAALAASPDHIDMPDIQAVQHPFSEPPNAVIAQFQRVLMRHIARFQRYPAGSGRDHLERTVQVAFVMGRDGRVVDAWVKSSSGEVALDQEAIDALHRAEPLPVIPDGLPSELSVLAPIAFARNRTRSGPGGPRSWSAS